MLFRQLFDASSSTYTYLLADDEGNALIIDPVFEQHARDAALLRELELELKWILETHVHADHVTGAWLLREATGAKIAISKASGAEGADRYLVHGDRIDIGGVKLEARATPGHTSGCMTFVDELGGRAFTGDALLVRGAGRTDFQQGSAAGLYKSIQGQIFSLPDDTLLYPAHDYAGRTVTTVREEKWHNPRVGGEASEGDFVGYMDNLNLPHPKKIDVAVPANLKLGEPEDGKVPAVADWGPVRRTFAGIDEIDAQWVNEHADEVTLVDVREAAERTGELGSLAGSLHLPLGELADRQGELPGDKPIVTVCRSGMRSARAVQILQKAGRERVANLRGGMLDWRAWGFPVEGGAH